MRPFTYLVSPSKIGKREVERWEQLPGGCLLQSNLLQNTISYQTSHRIKSSRAPSHSSTAHGILFHMTVSHLAVSHILVSHRIIFLRITFYVITSHSPKYTLSAEMCLFMSSCRKVSDKTCFRRNTSGRPLKCLHRMSIRCASHIHVDEQQTVKSKILGSHHRQSLNLSSKKNNSVP